MYIHASYQSDCAGICAGVVTTHHVEHYPHHYVCEGRIFPYFEGWDELALLCLENSVPDATCVELYDDGGYLLASAWKNEEEDSIYCEDYTE